MDIPDTEVVIVNDPPDTFAQFYQIIDSSHAYFKINDTYFFVFRYLVELGEMVAMHRPTCCIPPDRPGYSEILL